MAITVQTLKLRPKLVKLDVTEHCQQAWLKKRGAARLFEVYLFDENRHVHCCELMPSHELHLVYCRAEPVFPYADLTETAREALAELECEAEVLTDSVCYVHVGKLTVAHDFGDRPTPADYDSEWADWLESERCNPEL